ncbi:MAG: ABATE domain-containing protein [Proteobacteria bacterium]|nr:ABATE domain-containing protein [Pseudomonadota bacterium]
MERSDTVRSAHPPKYLAGAICLDFANTLSGRMDPAPIERIDSYAALVAWAAQGGLLTEPRAADLLGEARGRLKEAQTAVARAAALRAAIHQAFAARAVGRVPDPDPITDINAALAAAMRHRRLEVEDGRVAWGWEKTPDALDQMLWPVAQSAADVLTASDPVRVKECPGIGCGWLFVDRSKNGSRRWCEMEVCGNRAKARRFKTRQNAPNRGARE